ncbi:MAG: sugar ABC transporter substrate-binding protein [Clostridia bacterium]|nr:sugar ABC transporter substrate-binding protein [Clostridia bacterium]
MKKGIILVTVVIMLLSLLTGCAPSTEGETDPQENSDPKPVSELKIGVVSQSMKEQVYRDMKAGAEAKANEAGVTLKWQTCDYDAQKQLQIVNNYITQGFDVLIIEPVNPETSVPLMEAAQAANVPVVNLEAEVKGGDGAAVRVTCDFNAIGRAQMQKFVDDWGSDEPANVVILAGTKTDNVAQEMVKGYHEILDNNPHITVVQEEWHNNWDRQLAMNTMQNVLARGDKVHGVIGNNDAMTIGAVRAAEEAKVKDSILFYSMDHDRDAVEEMKAGTKYSDIDKSSHLQGERLFESAFAIAQGQEPLYDEVVDGVKTWFTPFRFSSWDDLSVSKEVYPDMFE